MSRDDLDAWFAKADDVLRTWDDSPDAMRAGAAEADVDPELPYIPDGRDVSFPLRSSGRLRRSGSSPSLRSGSVPRAVAHFVRRGGIFAPNPTPRPEARRGLRLTASPAEVVRRAREGAYRLVRRQF